jgi:hypothetical protein
MKVTKLYHKVDDEFLDNREIVLQVESDLPEDVAIALIECAELMYVNLRWGQDEDSISLTKLAERLEKLDSVPLCFSEGELRILRYSSK